MTTYEIEKVLQKFITRCKYGISSSDISLAAQEIAAKTDEVMPTITDEEIEAHFTTPHYHYEKGHYYKIRKDRIFGAKWMRDEIRRRMGEVRPIFKNHGTQISDKDDEHPTNKEKFDGNYLPDTDENR